MIDLNSEKIRKDVIRREFFDEDDSFFEKLNISKNRYAKTTGLHMFLRELSDGYYYVKKQDEDKICNEIVGRYLCNKLHLETTTLEILYDNNEILIATPNYRKPDLQYQYPNNIGIDMILCRGYDALKLSSLSKDYQSELLKLIIIDIMMEQYDRHSSNMEEVIVDGKVHLAPVIDFENSFLYVPMYKYFNPYVSIPKDIVSVYKFLNDYKEAYQYFIEIFDIDSDELIKYIENNYPIKVDSKIKEKYYCFTKKNQMILRRLTNR